MSTSVIGLHRFEMDRGQAFDRHVHEEFHQLAWASSGVVMVDVDDRFWVLPPTLALWLPAGVPHTSIAIKDSVLEGVYLDRSQCPVAWPTPTVVAVSKLARELILYLTRQDLADPARIHAEAVLLDVLAPVTTASIEVPMPRDARARAVAELLLAQPGDPRGLTDLGRQVGGSPRTLLRIFLAETGLTFAQWRTHSRLQSSIALLAEGESVARVATQVGYSTPSAFVAAFRRVTGHTPAAYFAEIDPPRIRARA